MYIIEILNNYYTFVNTIVLLKRNSIILSKNKREIHE